MITLVIMLRTDLEGKETGQDSVAKHLVRDNGGLKERQRGRTRDLKAISEVD